MIALPLLIVAALAGPPQDITATPVGQTYMNAAQTYWATRAPSREQSCNGRPARLFVADLKDGPGIATLGASLTPGCDIVVARFLLDFPSLACTITAHEYGHTLGFPHSANPNDLMYPEPTVTPGDCAAKRLTARMRLAKSIARRRAARLERSGRSSRRAKARPPRSGS